ncbi:hypothetical protein [Streptomyces nigrescens]|uniref:hypothetical protein n=1 Tax=Streptomyces nigrescens TaxID=1920 RepID=UPI0036FA7A26
MDRHLGAQPAHQVLEVLVQGLALLEVFEQALDAGVVAKSLSARLLPNSRYARAAG